MVTGVAPLGAPGAAACAAAGVIAPKAQIVVAGSAAIKKDFIEKLLLLDPLPPLGFAAETRRFSLCSRPPRRLFVGAYRCGPWPKVASANCRCAVACREVRHRARTLLSTSSKNHRRGVGLGANFSVQSRYLEPVLYISFAQERSPRVVRR